MTATVCRAQESHALEMRGYEVPTVEATEERAGSRHYLSLVSPRHWEFLCLAFPMRGLLHTVFKDTQPMNTRPTQLTLLGLACGILLALLIAPQTRWLVRAQLPSLLPHHHEQQKQAFVQQHPSDFPVQLGGQADDSTQSSLVYARSLVAKFPESASLRAYILRQATAADVHIHRNENYLVNNDPIPPHQAGSQSLLPTPAHLAEFDADAAAGEQLDPDNAYFPFMRAIGLFAAHRDQEGLAAVQRASLKPIWREYIEDEVEGRWRIIDAVYGGREAISASAVAASVLFPNYAGLRAAARVVLYKAILDEQAGRPEAGLAKRKALGRCGELMAVQSTMFIGNLVGAAINAISRSRPGGALPLRNDPRLSGEQSQQKHLEIYCAYVTKIGHPEAATEAQADYQSWQQIHRVGSKIGEYAMGIRMTDYFHLGAALFAGWTLLPNVLMLLLLGLTAAGLRRLPRIEARRPLPIGANLGFWSFVVIVLLIGTMFVSDLGGSFEFFAALLILTPLAFAALVILFVPHLRHSTATALLSAGVTLGAIGLLAAFAAWQMRGAYDFASILQGFFPQDGSSNNSALSNKSVQTLLTYALGLAIPLLTAIILSIVSRVKRVPVSVGLVFGFRAVMPPLVFALMLAYGGLTVWTAQQEARANYGLERSLHGEGQYLAEVTGQAWPQLPLSRH